jgi:exodeoxyribonuclease VII small subunit
MPAKSKSNESMLKIPVEQLTYEQAFSQMQEVVSSLETEEHALNEALELFERGQALAKHCAVLLEKAELKVQQISGDETIPFEAHL